MSESSVEPSPSLESAEKSHSTKKERIGTVISDQSDKTAVVRVTRRVPHPLYKKIIKKSKRYHVHDPENRAVVGDRVSIVECAPVSRLKRWKLKEILKH